MTDCLWQRVNETSPGRSSFTLRARSAGPPPKRDSYPATKPSRLEPSLLDAIPTRILDSTALP